MEIVVRGRHIEVSEQFREHAVEKLQRLEHHGSAIARIDVEVTRERNPRLNDRAIKVELTCLGRGPVVRAESADHDKYVAFDAAADRLTERLRRNADRRRARTRSNGKQVPPPEAFIEAAAATAEGEPAASTGQSSDVVFAEGPVVVREKTHPSSPMTVEQALDALELVGHDFYLFHDIDTDKPSVVYRRRGYDYGLIRLEMDEAGRAAS